MLWLHLLDGVLAFIKASNTEHSLDFDNNNIQVHRGLVSILHHIICAQREISNMFLLSAASGKAVHHFLGG